MNNHESYNNAAEKELKKYLSQKGESLKRLLVVEPSGCLIFVDVEEDKVSLKELQRLVDGYIELYPKRDTKFQYIVDEEGLLKNKPYNRLAKELFDVDVVGSLVLCPTGLFD